MNFGKLTVTTTPQQFASEGCVGGLRLKADPSNTGVVWIGIVADPPSESVLKWPLAPGQTVEKGQGFSPADMNELAVASTTVDDVVCWMSEAVG